MPLINNSMYVSHLCVSAKSEAQWSAENPVLMAGELAVTTNSNISLAGESLTAARVKIGDGVTPWSSLQYSDKHIIDTVNSLHERLNQAEALISQYEQLADAQLTYLNSWTSKLETEEGFN